MPLQFGKTFQEGNYMKKNTLILFALLFTLTLFPHPATSGWMDEAKSLVDKYKEKNSSKSNGLTDGDIASGLKEALTVGTANVVGRLGKENGFNKDPKVHIPLPDNMKKVRKVLKKIKQEKLADDLELRLNRAAEIATPKAKKHFLKAIKAMTLKDARKIWQGPDDAATRYFEGKMTGPLKKEMSPVISDSLAEVGAIKSYEKTVGRYKKIPFVPDIRADLTSYVTGKGLEGIFYYLAREEAAIRKDPIKRTTDLLKKVFGTKE